MAIRTRPAWCAPASRACAIVVLLVLAYACAPSAEPAEVASPTPEAGGQESDAGRPASDGTLTVYGCPVVTLLPQDSRDTCSTRVVRQLFSGLTELDAETGEPRLLVASSIDTEDTIEWTVTLEDGWRFSNGEPVTARSFVDAWNHTADPDLGHHNRDLFNVIAGYEEFSRGESDRLRGLKVVDDRTLQITLDEPFTSLPAQLTDVAFTPLPSVAYEDMDAFARAPIGNGRYELASFDPDRDLQLRRNEQWPGPGPAANDAVTFVIYHGDNAVQVAYDDVRAGALDVLDNVPPERIGEVDETFPGRVVHTPTSSFTFLGFAFGSDGAATSGDLRRALSLAIDRERVIDEIFDGVLRPATSVIPPVLDAHRADACDVCTFDPERAVELFESSGGWDGPMTLHYNSGSGHERWIRAVADQWGEVLGIDEFVFDGRGLVPYLDMLEAGEAEGPFRLGWALSYPSPGYVLEELFGTTGSGNYFGFSDPAVDAAIRQAASAPPQDAIAAYHAAEDLVLEQMPLIPLWYGTSTSVHTERVTDVVVDASTVLRVELLKPVE